MLKKNISVFCPDLVGIGLPVVVKKTSLWEKTYYIALTIFQFFCSYLKGGILMQWDGNYYIPELPVDDFNYLNLKSLEIP